MIDLSVIVLTHNESKHLARCLESFRGLTNKFFVIDSYSTDNTVEIAEKSGSVVVQRAWVSYAFQLNYGIDNNPHNTRWVMRIDADEYLTPELATELTWTLSDEKPDVTGFYMKRRVIFMNQWIRHGGYYPIWLLRIWENGKGRCEELWMDEHIKLTEGQTQNLAHDLVDHNLNNLTWWTQKHNNYSIREAIDLLNIKHNFENKETISPSLFGTQEQRTRYLKIKYASLPLFTRPFIYFFYRYVIKLGFLDGTRGLIWHCLQGFWYRFLVDAKIFETYQRAGKDKQAIAAYFLKEYGRNIAQPNRSVDVR